MTDWRQLERDVDGIVGAAFGETVRHFPKKAGATDPDRSEQDIVGILHTPTPKGTVSFGNGMVTSIAASESALVVNRADYPDVVFRKDDKLRAADREGTLWWSVRHVDDRYTSIIILALSDA